MPCELLNYDFKPHGDLNAPTLVFLHGLFGDKANLGVIARHFSHDYALLSLDLRNHGNSFHAVHMSYEEMAKDSLAVLDHLNIATAILIGHSMGAKVAMKLADIAPLRISKLIAIDMSAKAQKLRHHNIFEALFKICRQKPRSRNEARAIINAITDLDTSLFLLKSYRLQTGDFRFNLQALWENYEQIMGWQKVCYHGPSLFIKGGNSDYIKEQDYPLVLEQFPHAKLFTIAGAGHMVHVQKTDALVRKIASFLRES